MSIAVITPSLPERAGFLAEAVASVNTQALRPDLHLIGIDTTGVANMLNRLYKAAGADWTAVLEDDDLLHPNHLALLTANATRADIVYSYCKVEGRDGWTPNNPDAAQCGGHIPVTALYRTRLLDGLEGWRPVALPDHDLYQRALSAGATFKCVPEVTWTYRFHGGNDTLTGYREQRGAL